MKEKEKKKETNGHYRVGKEIIKEKENKDSERKGKDRTVMAGRSKIVFMTANGFFIG